MLVKNVLDGYVCVGDHWAAVVGSCSTYKKIDHITIGMTSTMKGDVRLSRRSTHYSDYLRNGYSAKWAWTLDN